MKWLSFTNRGTWGIMLVLAIVLAVTTAGMVIYFENKEATSAKLPPIIPLSGSNDMLIPGQQTFLANNDYVTALEWLAGRWGVTTNQVYVIVQDEEPWMEIIGVLESQSLSSARVWLIDTTHPEGLRWKAGLERQGTPHEDNIYLVSEYKPLEEAEKLVAAKFYATKTLGGLAIIEDIRWIDIANGSGTIQAYHSQKYLPSVSIPIQDGIPLKNQAQQTPISHP